MTAREHILASIRSNLARARTEADDVRPLMHVESSTDAALDTHRPLDERVAHFEAVLTRVGGHVHRAASDTEAASILAGLAQAGALVAFTNAPELSGIRDALVRERSDIDAFEYGEDRDRLLDAAIGVTTAQAGIAETGSLVLRSGGERHRLVSLLPEVHVALLDPRAIVDTLGEALLADDPVQPSRAVTLITGPSRTADIELTLVVGIHGPRALHVILTESGHNS